MLMRVVEPRRARDDRDHLVEHPTGLKACAGHAVAFAAGLLFGAGQGAQAQGGGELSLAVLSSHRQHRGSHQTLAGLVGLVDGADKLFLPRPQLELRAGERTRRAGQRFNETNDALCAAEPGPSHG